MVVVPVVADTGDARRVAVAVTNLLLLVARGGSHTILLLLDEMGCLLLAAMGCLSLGRALAILGHASMPLSNNSPAAHSSAPARLAWASAPTGPHGSHTTAGPKSLCSD